MPGALTEDICRIAFLVSLTVGNSPSRTLHSICGSLLIACSLTDDGRLSTLSKCSVHLSKVASLSVYALSSGVAPEHFGL